MMDSIILDDSFSEASSPESNQKNLDMYTVENSNDFQASLKISFLRQNQLYTVTASRRKSSSTANKKRPKSSDCSPHE